MPPPPPPITPNPLPTSPNSVPPSQQPLLPIVSSNTLPTANTLQPVGQQPTEAVQAQNNRPTSFLSFFIQHIRTDAQTKLCKRRYSPSLLFINQVCRAYNVYFMGVHRPCHLVSHTVYVIFCLDIFNYMASSDHQVRSSWAQ